VYASLSCRSSSCFIDDELGHRCICSGCTGTVKRNNLDRSRREISLKTVALQLEETARLNVVFEHRSQGRIRSDRDGSSRLSVAALIEKADFTTHLSIGVVDESDLRLPTHAVGEIRNNDRLIGRSGDIRDWDDAQE